MSSRVKSIVVSVLDRLAAIFVQNAIRGGVLNQKSQIKRQLCLINLVLVAKNFMS